MFLLDYSGRKRVVEIIRNHGPGGREAKDRVDLVLDWLSVVTRRFRSRSAIFRQLPGMFRGQPDLKDAWPQFSCDKKALSNWIVSDAV